METSRSCPIDRERIGKKDLVGAPRVVLELVGELRIRCNDCKGQMKRDDFGRHEAECEARKKENSNADDEDERVRKSDSQVAVDEEDIIECSDCHEPIRSTKIEVSSLHSSPIETQLNELSFLMRRPTRYYVQLFLDHVATALSRSLRSPSHPTSSPPALSFQLPVLMPSSDALISVLASPSPRIISTLSVPTSHSKNVLSDSKRKRGNGKERIGG